jgi:DNA polymerase-3 subunit beta
VRVACLQENLAKGLAIVGRAVSPRSVLPVLHNVLIATEHSQLKLAATDLSTTITCWIGAKVEEEGATTIPARLLTEFVNSLSPEQIELELVARTQTVHLKCARTEAHIKVIDAQEFPIIPSMEGDHKISVDTSTLRRMIDLVTFAAATDESRPILTGTLVEFGDSTLTMAAADGFRLSVRSAVLSQAVGEPMKVIVPARTLAEVARVATDEERPVEIIVTPKRNQILFRISSKDLGGPIELISQLIEGNFPDYKRIIPSGRNTRTVVNTQDFLRAAKIALLFARDATAANTVRLQIAPGEETTPGRLVLATIAEVGDNVDQLDASVEGDPVEIAFNARYLIDLLSVLNSPQVVLETSSPSSPGVFRPVGDEEFIHVIMPMYIREESEASEA